jgi:PAS domain S-box-containing protein
MTLGPASQRESKSKSASKSPTPPFKGTKLERQVQKRSAKLAKAYAELKSQIGQRELVEAELKREREFVERLINSAVEGIFAFDRQCRYTVWNPAMEQIWKLSKDQVMRRVAFEVVPFLKETGEDKLFLEALAGNTVVAKERRYRVPETGQEGFFEGHYSPVRDLSGEIIGGIAIIHDISDRKRAEVALRESEQRLHSILDSSPSIIFIKNMQGRYLYVNSQFQRICNLAPDQIVGKTDREIFPSAQAEAFRANDLKVSKAGVPLVFEEGAVHEDGLHTSIVNKFPLRDSIGDVCAICGIVTDITERTRAEEALRTANKMLREQAQLLDLAHDAIIVREVNNSITFWSPGAEKTYGWSKEEALGKMIHTLLQTQFPQPLDDFDRKLLDDGSWEGELVQTRRDGNQITVASRQVLQRGDQGQGLAILEISRDVTQRKCAEESLREISGRLLSLQDEERRRLARELHDSTAQSLAALSMNLEVVKDSGVEFSPQVQLALSESVVLATQCLREIRTLCYLLHPPQPGDFGLASALQWYVAGFAKRSGIEVRLQAPREFPCLPQAVEMTLFRIVQESLSNIHRHSGSLTAEVRVELEPQQVNLEVRDKGRGIPAAILEHVNGSLADLGVGIAGMRERLRQLGGKVEIHSDSHGTVVRSSLPLVIG